MLDDSIESVLQFVSAKVSPGLAASGPCLSRSLLPAPSQHPAAADPLPFFHVRPPRHGPQVVLWTSGWIYSDGCTAGTCDSLAWAMFEAP